MQNVYSIRATTCQKRQEIPTFYIICKDGHISILSIDLRHKEYNVTIKTKFRLKNQHLRYYCIQKRFA